MPLILEILVSIFLLIGAFFMLVGGIGMVRLPDLFMRLHAPTKSSTLGLGSCLIAAIIFSAMYGRFWPLLRLPFLKVCGLCRKATNGLYSVWVNTIRR